MVFSSSIAWLSCKWSQIQRWRPRASLALWVSLPPALVWSTGKKPSAAAAKAAQLESCQHQDAQGTGAKGMESLHRYSLKVCINSIREKIL